MEYFEGDPAFRDAAERKGLTATDIEKLKSIGVDFTISEIDFLSELAEVRNAYSIEKKLLHTLRRKSAQHDLLALWLEYTGQDRPTDRNVGEVIPDFLQNEKFSAWRARRVRAAMSELGVSDQGLFRPAVAIELTDGCSVGCWFCAFAVHPLQSVLDYSANNRLFSTIVRECLGLLGPEVSRATALYFGSEPYDNPHYIDFMRDYEKITGHKPFTSTSVSHDDAWIRGLLHYYGQMPGTHLRINVLTIDSLRRIHGAYTPEELHGVELSIKMSQGRNKKVTSGKILSEHAGLRENPAGEAAPQGSIACLSGFVINLPTRTIRLISPSQACKRWPNGYRVFDSVSFGNEANFSAILQGLIVKNMHTSPVPTQIVRFRDDLIFRQTNDGFDLISPAQIHHFRSAEGCGPLGALIAQGNLTVARVQAILVEKHGVNPFSAFLALRNLYDGGFIDETCTAT